MMKKTFFFKRGLQFKLRSEEHFAELAIGVSGEIDPLSGMIINLADLIRWFENFQSQIKMQSFSDVIQLLQMAYKAKQEAIFEIHDIYGSNHSYVLRLENQKLNLQISSFEKTQKIYRNLEITDAAQLEKILSSFQKDQWGSLPGTMQREELISGIIFSEN